ncbi:MAG: capsular biosynthesis protein [Tenericutes bacterium]|nr:capsular biosynthesis protein [Mycoplasmatota bacterium]
MIDIHTHILPCVDDGSPDMQTSIDLIKEEITQGVTDVFVTPHYFKQRGYLSPVKENIEGFNSLKEEIEKQGLKVNLYLGNEIYYNIHTLRDLESGLTKPLGNSKYVLIEFSLFEEDEDIAEAVHNLTAKGYLPIIAHPERYPYLNDLNSYAYLKRMGALIQLNASSLTGDYGRKVKKFVLKAIKNNLVDFVASDIHDFRMSNLLRAYDVVKTSFSKEIADKLFNNSVILS